MRSSAGIFKALSDETRLRIFILLKEQGELCVCDLMAALELPQSTVSRHVAYMKNAGLLSDRRGGVWMYYSIRPDFDLFLQTLTDGTFARLHNTETAAADRTRLIAYRTTKVPPACS